MYFKMKGNNHSKMLKCRLCNKCVKPNEAQYIFLQDTNEMTALGQRLMAILNVEAKELKDVSHVCCNVCSFKAEECFSLLMDVHSANVIIKKIHEKSLNLDISIHTLVNTVLFKCDKCDEVLNDMDSYTQHFEIHTLLEIADLCSGSDKEMETRGILDTIEFENFKTEPEDVVIIVNDGPTEEVQTTENVTNYTVTGNLPAIKAAYYNRINAKMFQPAKYECDFCKMRIGRKRSLKNHIVREHLKPMKEEAKKNKVMICKFCSNAFPRGKFKKHAIACRSELLSQGTLLCDICGKSIPAEAMRSHIYRHQLANKGMHTCTICQKSCTTRAGLRNHMILHDESKFIVCEVCGLKTNPRLMWKHLKTHKTKENICDICGKAFMFNYLLQTHKKIHEKDPNTVKNGIRAFKGHKCPKCNKRYTFVSMLNIHLRDDHNDPGIDVKSPFACAECDKTFDDRFSLKNHFMLMHNATKEDLAGMSRGNIILGAFECPECSRVLQSDFGLRQHLRIVHNMKNKDMPALMKRKCEKCDKTFSDKQGLVVHIKAVHLNIANIRCNLCDKTFKRYQSLVNHRLQHSGAKPFECEVCSRTFRQRADTIRHLQRHVRDGDVSIDEAVARNTSESSKLRKNRIFLKDTKYADDIWGNASKRKRKVIEVPEVAAVIELE